MRSAAKRQRRKTQREATRDRRQMDPEPTGEEEDLEIFFKNTRPEVDPPRSPSPTLLEPPVSPGELDYGVVLDMVQQINSKLGLLLDRMLQGHLYDPDWLPRHHINRWGSVFHVMCRHRISRRCHLRFWRFLIRHCAVTFRKTDRATVQLHRSNKSRIPCKTTSWFRHFKAVADVHGWDKGQRALQLVSYIDETAMNVAQELGDDELYDYDVLVKLLSDWFDPASRVSGRLRRHHEDADVYADAITELCCVGYPQSSRELRQELISEQLVRGQSDLSSRNICGLSSGPRNTANYRRWYRGVHSLIYHNTPVDYQFLHHGCKQAGWITTPWGGIWLHADRCAHVHWWGRPYTCCIGHVQP